MFGLTERKYIKKANSLVGLVSLHAGYTYNNLPEQLKGLTKYLSETTLEKWLYSYTVAGVSAAIIMLGAGVTEGEFRKRAKPIKEALTGFQKDAGNSFIQLGEVVHSYVDSNLDLHGGNKLRAMEFALGSWVIQTIKGHVPNEDEVQLAKALGHHLFLAVDNWWREI